MKLHYLIILAILAGCTGGLPSADTMETGAEVSTPRQYEEFCERDVNDICPEIEEKKENE